jgi:hypothetical protein
MVLTRKNFDDFLQYTERSFTNNINCYQPERYGEGVFHPLGCVPKDDYESGDYFRVYETWKGVQENIDRRSRERALARSMKYMKYGLLKVGITGGIDRPSADGGELE